MDAWSLYGGQAVDLGCFMPYISVTWYNSYKKYLSKPLSLCPLGRQRARTEYWLTYQTRSWVEFTTTNMSTIMFFCWVPKTIFWEH